MGILVMDGAFCITSVNIIRLSYVKPVSYTHLTLPTNSLV